MNIYISASIPRKQEAYDLGNLLRAAGHNILSQWHNTIGKNSDANYHSQDKAVRDLDGVNACEVFIELVGDTKSRGGRHCELGLAIAGKKKIILIGPDDDCIFTWLPGLTKIESIEKFIAERVTNADLRL